MRRSQIISIVLFVIVLGIAIYVGNSIYNKKTDEINAIQTEIDDLYMDLQSRDSLVNELISEINDIEQSLMFVKEKRQQLSLETIKEGEGRNKKQAIKNDIRLVNEMLEESSKRIATLEKKLKNSGFQINSLKNKIESLTQNIEEQNVEIARLQQDIQERDVLIADYGTKVDSMKVVIDNKVDTLIMQKEEINKKTNEQNKAFYTYGTYKELAENGVMEKEGGFLGIGKHKSVKDNINGNYFTELDIRETKSIPVHSKKAKLITEHPDSSYNFVKEEGKIAFLEIENPEEFWKISKYAVIEIK